MLGDDRLRLGIIGVAPLVVIAGKVLRLYDRDENRLHKSTLDELPTLFHLATLYTLLVWLLQGPLVDGTLGKAQIAALWMSIFVFVSLARVVARAGAQRLSSPERCLFIGDEGTYRWLAQKIASSHQVGAEVVGFLRVQSNLDLLDRATLSETLTELEVDRVIIAPQWQSGVDPMLSLMSSVKSLGVKVSLVPRMFEVIGHSVEFDVVDGVTMLGVRRFGLTRSSNWVKRSFDVLGAGAIGLFVAPLCALLALLVRIDSPGPVLFRQARVGRDGKSFEMIKFRSMVQDADAQKADLGHLNEAQGLFKITNDPRITRVGRILRKTSLDELPQLLNVLRGEMSLVGPRPLVIEDDRRVQGWHRRRLHLMPGMTGPWQVLGSSRIPLQEMVTIDYLYVANWSLWADVKILLRTVSHVATARGR